jgi:hypothetical protein
MSSSFSPAGSVRVAQHDSVVWLWRPKLPDGVLNVQLEPISCDIGCQARRLCLGMHDAQTADCFVLMKRQVLCQRRTNRGRGGSIAFKADGLCSPTGPHTDH